MALCNCGLRPCSRSLDSLHNDRLSVGSNPCCLHLKPSAPISYHASLIQTLTEKHIETLETCCRASIPSKPMKHIGYSPISAKLINFPLFSFFFTFWLP